MVFSITDAEKSYENRTLFKNFDLHISAGEIKAIVGANGCGKTSFLRGASGEIPMNWSARQFPKAGEWALVKPSATGFFRNLSVVENLKLFCEDTSLSIEFLNNMGLSEVIQQPQYQLSLGQNSLLHIARGLGNKKLKLLMIDEVTAHLDLIKKQELYKYLRKITNAGMGLLVTAQEKNQLEGLTDVILEI